MTQALASDIAAELRETVGAALSVAWTEVPDADLPEVMVVLERAQALLDAAKVAVAGRLVATTALRDAGWASTSDFLTAAGGGSKGSGPGLVRLVERLDAVPRVAEALAAGCLSRAKAEVIATKISTLPYDAALRDHAERLMLELAGAPGEQGLDATDLARAWRGVVARLDPDGSLLGSVLGTERQERAAHQGRFLSMTPDGYGGARLRGYGTVEDLERIKAALLPLAAPVRSEPGACGARTTDSAGERLPYFHPERRSCPDHGCAHDGRDPRDHGARLFDALLTVCDHQAARPAAPGSHGAAPRLVVTMTYDALVKAVDESGAGLIGSGDHLSAHAVRRLACDAEIIPAVLGSRSEILDVGRSQRLVTTAIWNALVLRDRHCAFPGCTRLPQACDAHHIRHWVDGGSTSLENLILLCRHHHTLTHHTPWTVFLDAATRRPVWRPPPDTGVRPSGRYPGAPPPALPRAG